ncbi:hypothetical protein ACTTAM_16040 [Rhodobacter capsulatus]
MAGLSTIELAALTGAQMAALSTAQLGFWARGRSRRCPRRPPRR